MQKILNYPYNENRVNDFLTGVTDIPSSRPAGGKNALQEINNYLKSPDEMEAEFTLIAHAENTITCFNDAHKENPVTREWLVTINNVSPVLSDFMEENY